MKVLNKLLVLSSLCLCALVSLKDVRAIENNKDYFSVIKEDGTVELVPYNKESDIAPINDDISLTALEDITYGVARIKGYTTYTEYDGVKDKTSRSSYVSGDSANDAAYIGVVSNGKKVRVKLAGVYMDIPVANVVVSSYSSSSKVSYYKGVNGILYHYYYYGNYGSTSTLASTIVGYTPDYLKDNVKYYSYDGHYFYTDYKKMLTDYKTGVNVYTNSINKNTPYYNYYQYLSFRAPTTLTKTQINKYLSKYTGPSSSRPNSKLYNKASALLGAQNDYGVNAALMLGIAINESAWGNSKYALNNNNLFGLNVTDDGNSVAYSFDSVEECFDYFASVTISGRYLEGGYPRYRGPHLGDKQSGVNVEYCSDPYWGEKAAAFSYYMDMNASNTDYLHYDIAIAKIGNVSYYKDSALSKYLYSSGAEVSSTTNLNVYNVPFVVLSESSKAYKIYSDTTLKSDRSEIDMGNYTKYDPSRDYVYIDKTKVFLTYETQKNKEIITLNKTSASLTVGKRLILIPSVDVTTWTSSNTSIATVKEGIVTALKPGTVTITAKTAKGNTATCKVTITKAFPFTDVSSKMWYYPYIDEAYHIGLMSGATETLFKPDAKMNRAMVAIVFHRIEGTKPVEYSKVFKDVYNNQYYTTSVLWAKEAGIINGYKDGTFKPLRNVTREEMVTMITNFAKYKNKYTASSTSLSKYTDYKKISSYAFDSMKWGIKNGIISGKDNGTRLDPLGFATRAEACKMLLNAYKLIK